MRSLGRTLFAGLVAALALGALASVAVADGTFPEATAPSEVVVQPAKQTGSGFVLSGALNPESSPTSYYFVYKEAGAGECEDQLGCGGTRVGEGGPLTGDTQQEVPPVEVSGLVPGQTYVYWLIARNSKGAVRGNELTFTAPEGMASKSPEASGGGDQPSVVGGTGQPAGSPGPLSSAPLVPVDLSSPPVSPVPKLQKAGSALKLKEVLKACEKKPKGQRAGCARWARSRYARTAKKR